MPSRRRSSTSPPPNTAEHRRTPFAALSSLLLPFASLKPKTVSTSTTPIYRMHTTGKNPTAFYPPWCANIGLRLAYTEQQPPLSQCVCKCRGSFLDPQQPLRPSTALACQINNCHYSFSTRASTRLASHCKAEFCCSRREQRSRTRLSCPLFYHGFSQSSRDTRWIFETSRLARHRCGCDKQANNRRRPQPA